MRRPSHLAGRSPFDRLSGDTVLTVKDDLTNESQRLAKLSRAMDAAERHRDARIRERDRLDTRDRSIVGAVRAGALLSEIAAAAQITRAAASLAARRTLPPRAGRGGPYSRRRGTAAAVRSVAEAALRLGEAKAESRMTKQQRDRAIAAAVAGGTGVGATARALGMTTPAVSLIARGSTKEDATKTPDGAVASQQRSA